MDGLICAGFWLVGALAAVVLYRRFYRFGYWDREHNPLFFNRDDPGDVWEYNAITTQRKHGRERGGPLVWRAKDETTD